MAESASMLTAGRGMGVESRQPDLCPQQWSQGLSTRSSFRSTLAARTFLVLRSGYGSILSIFLVPSDVHKGTGLEMPACYLDCSAGQGLCLQFFPSTLEMYSMMGLGSRLLQRT